MAEREGGLKGKRGQAPFYKEDSDRKPQAVLYDNSMDSVSNKLGMPVPYTCGHISAWPVGYTQKHGVHQENIKC